MCWQDVKIGRLSDGQISSVSVGTSATLIADASPIRTCVILSCPAANRVTIANTPNVTDGAGLVLYAAGGVVVLDIQRHGNIVTKQLYGISNTSSNTIGVLLSEYGGPKEGP